LGSIPAASEARVRRGSQNFVCIVYEFSISFKATWQMLITSWDHDSPVHAIFKFIVYGFFNSPWGQWVCRESFCEELKQRFAYKLVVSKRDAFYHTALKPGCSLSYTVLLGKPPFIPGPFIWWLPITSFYRIDNVPSWIVLCAKSDCTSDVPQQNDHLPHSYRPCSWGHPGKQGVYIKK
jgi:hypothetical protein